MCSIKVAGSSGYDPAIQSNNLYDQLIYCYIIAFKLTLQSVCKCNVINSEIILVNSRYSFS